MTDLTNLIAEQLSNNRRLCAELMDAWSTYPIEKGDFTFTVILLHGGEDEGSDYYSVAKVEHILHPSEYKLVKFQGWYQSYKGAEYESWSFVEPVQKTITVYE